MTQLTTHRRPRLEIRTLVCAALATAPPYRSGDVIADAYRVDEVLGCGAMAWVLRATRVHLHDPVALLLLRSRTTRETVARLFRDGRIATRAPGDAVTRVLNVDRLPDGSPFLVMGYVNGLDFKKLAAEPGWVPVTAAVDFAIQACENCDRMEDGPSEVWSLGVLLWELLGAERTPFDAAASPEAAALEPSVALSEVRPDLPLGLESVVCRCVEKEPSRRFPDAKGLAIALAPYASRSGQLRARRLQHARLLHGASAPLDVRPSLPAMRFPPRRTSTPPVTTLALLPAAPSATPAALAAMPGAPAERPPLGTWLAWNALALSVLGCVMAVAMFVSRPLPSRAGPVRTVAAAAPAAAVEDLPGVANRMPDAIPAAPVTVPVTVIEAPSPATAPVDSSEAPPPAMQAAPSSPPAAQVAPGAPAPKAPRRPRARAVSRVGPDGF